MSDHSTDPATETFVAHRNLLFTVAYEMLGSAADAEDVLQETWLRWVKVDLDQVRDQRAYLVRITTRQSLNRLRSMSRRKEAYVGPWLPEPLLTAPDVAEDVELAESVSMALMLVLETLSPTERAVFVLREAFDVSYEEIAAAVDKSPAAVRQIAHRARRHVEARRPREVVSASETRAALEAFRRVLETGHLQGLLDVLAPEVVLMGDGGGIKQAALRPITGADKVARFMIGGLGKNERPITVTPTVVNGSPALLVRLDGEIDGVMAIRLENARITGLYYVRNPPRKAVPSRVRDAAHPAMSGATGWPARACAARVLWGSAPRVRCGEVRRSPSRRAARSDQPRLVGEDDRRARSRRASLEKMRATWDFTVASLSVSSAASSVLDRPRPSSVRTSSSRGVRAVRSPWTAGGRSVPEAKRSTRRRVMDGARRASPVSTSRTAAARCSGVTSLRRKPLAPIDRAV
ncbi:hypothetical protein SALBM311S_04908 [Streptomyces alboniger]